jgi:lipopolysaccharide export system protein LptA
MNEAKKRTCPPLEGVGEGKNGIVRCIAKIPKIQPILVFILFLFAHCLYAQQTTKVFLERADLQSFDQEIAEDRSVLTGNVLFRHDSSFMYCDSAYLFEKTNSLEAFGAVRMEQGDTLFVFGEYLHYNGNTRLAKIRYNVRMESIQTDSSIVTLFTDSLNYDRVTDIGYYFEGGMIIDAENELTSIYGQYSPGTKIAIFNDSVKLDNPKFVLNTDTLHYHTETKIATIVSPAVIVSDSATIYSSNGWYNTQENTSLLLDRSQVVSGDRILIGDTIAYDRNTGFGEAFGNIFLHDTLEKVILTGQYGYYNEQTEFAFATDSARCMEYSQGDTLYIRADTFQMFTVDSTAREIKAYYNVRFYRIDIQGVCDSMKFNTTDSVLCMYTDPILWNEQHQLYGDSILIFLKDSTVEYVHVIQRAFAVQELDSAFYNQMKGNDLKAWFEEKEVRQIDISGNAETIYYPYEEDGTMIGLNETKSSYMTIWLIESKIDKLKFWPEPQGTLTPLPFIQSDQKTLRGFFWYDYLRPLDSDDIFRDVKIKTEDKPQRSNRFN